MSQIHKGHFGTELTGMLQVDGCHINQLMAAFLKKIKILRN